MKRIICFILCLIMVMSTVALVSCAEKETNKGGDEVEEGPKDDTYLTGYDFEGAVIKFAIACGEKGNPLNNAYRSCMVEEKTGDSVVDAIYDRNQIIKSRLNVEIEVIVCTSNTQFTPTVEPALLAGDDEYDWLWGQQANDIDLCLQGYVYDLNKLGDRSLVDPDAEWWAAEYMDYYQYKNEMYWLSGPLCLNYTGGASCVFVNSTLYDANIDPTYGDIYDLVRAGNWTIDEFAAMSSMIYKDVNSNEKLDEGDIIGSSFSSSWAIMQLLGGVGVECSTRNPDGSITFDINTKNDKYISSMQKTYNLFNQTTGINNSTKWACYFADGAQLFRYGSVSTMSGFREMEDDFYVVPTPKLDKEQPEYRAIMSDGNNLMGLAYTCQNIEAATATLELMAYFTDQMVTDLYYDEVLKYKYSRDDSTAEMVDLVTDSIYTDFVLIWEKYLWDEHWLRYKGYGPSVVSTIRKSESSWIQRFNETLAKLDELANEQYE